MNWVLKPDAVIDIAGRALTAAEAGLAGLAMVLETGTVGSARLGLWPRSAFQDAAPGETVALAIGSADNPTPVFTGVIEAVRRDPGAVVIEAREAPAPLLEARLNRSFVNQTVAAIVRGLAGDVPVSAAESDIDLALYAVEGRRSVWTHLRELAALAGADLHCTADGALVFAPYGAGRSHTLRRGIDLLSWETLDTTAPTAATYGVHGAGSRAGADRWHWLDPAVKGAEAGESRVLGAFATADAAEAATAAAAARAANAALRARARVWGRPDLRVGDTVDLVLESDDGGGLLEAASDALTGALGGGGASAKPPYRITGVSHVLNRDVGFVTALDLGGSKAPAEMAGDGGAAALAGGLP
jgi:phage protein D